MHLRIFLPNSNKGISEHFFYFLVYCGPMCRVVVLLELLDKVLVFNLFEIRDLAVVHYCELGLVRGHGSCICSVGIVGAANPEVFIKE